MLRGSRRRTGSGGQALIIAVLVLFAVATLAALFTAIISSQLVQVTRHSEVVELRNIAEAGLRLANEQLTFSMYGADWRPSARAYRCGSGQVSIGVSYGPVPDRLQSRFLRIVSTATIPDNPFLRHTIIALKPILLTDYARFITDRFETNRPARLGVTGLEFNGGQRGDYLYTIDGPIRSNTDIVWYGRSQVGLHTTYETAWADLGLLRDDRIEIAGQMRPDPSRAATDTLGLTVDGRPRASDLFSPQPGDEQADYAAGFPYWWEGEAESNSRTVLADLPTYVTIAGDELSPALSLPRVRPPEIDATHPDLETNRYLLLTRDSGYWRQADDGSWYNTGEYGWGWTNYGGAYIANLTDVQYVDPVTGQHDLDKLRLNWTRSVGVHDDGDPATPIRGDERPDPDGTQRPPSGPADWWDKTGRYYAPLGAEIVLHGESPCPYIEIFRYDDPDGDGLYWRGPEGEPTDTYTYAPLVGMCNPMAELSPIGIEGRRVRLPFPPNGVIYAEGNIRLSGTMPPVRDYRGRVGAMIPPDEVPEGYFGQRLTDQGRSRRFDLQVVSGGTIYIEGDLLTPRGALLIPDSIEADQLYGSRLALLARDCVCVNTTALNPRPVALQTAVPDDPDDPQAYFYYNDRQSTYSSSGNWGYLRLRGTQDANANSPAGAEGWEPETDGAFDAEPDLILFDYHNVQLQSEELASRRAELRLMLGHSALYVAGSQLDEEEGGMGSPSGEPPQASTPTTPPPTRDEAGVEVAVYINDTALSSPYPWGFGTSPYFFLRQEVADPATRDESYQWYEDLDPTQLDASDNWTEMLPNDYQPMVVHEIGGGPLDSWITGDDVIEFISRVMPVREYIWNVDKGEWEVKDWEIRPQDLAYLLGPIAIAPPRDEDPLPVRIEALIYAQNGSWFVIPGRWFNEDADDLAVDPTAWEAPGYHEPLNMKISVYGAVSENLPADLGSAASWTSKWAGPIGRGGEGFLSYAYDPLLRAPRRETVGRIGYLRFPRFPVTSDLVIWGERVSGAPES